jgi:hypothetical protein
MKRAFIYLSVLFTLGTAGATSSGCLVAETSPHGRVERVTVFGVARRCAPRHYWDGRHCVRRAPRYHHHHWHHAWRPR